MGNANLTVCGIYGFFLCCFFFHFFFFVTPPIGERLWAEEEAQHK